MRISTSIFSVSAALVVAGTLSAASVSHAEDVKALRGKPSSDMILEALAPAARPEAKADAPAAKPAMRRRGLSLSNDDEAPAAQPVAATVPAPAPAAAAPSPAPAPVAAAQPQQRALDLDIQFQFNSDQLTNDGKDVLDQLATALKSEKLAAARSVVLEGHADAKGNPGYNQALSYKRAQSARTYLATRHGIAATKLKAVGKGSTEPADPAHPESEINRRVRVILEI